MTATVGMRFAVDEQTAIYLQTTSFLADVDPSLNQQLRSTLPANTVRRRAHSSSTVCEELAGHPNQLLTAGQWSELHALGERLGLSPEECRGIGYYFGWKVNLAQSTPSRILAFGCSTGRECIALKALFPHARQVLLDFNLQIPAAWATELNIEAMKTMTLEKYSAQEPAGFDLIFSNHTLEHLPDPDEALGQLYSLLNPGGVIVSAIPLEWYEGSQSKRAMEKMKAEGTLHQLDCAELQLGHLWKASPRDVADTLERVGFTRARLVQRVDYPSGWRNHRPMHRLDLQRREKLGLALNNVFLKPLRAVLKRTFPHGMPDVAARAYFALEARLWFSSMQLHHTTVRELTFVAVKPST